MIQLQLECHRIGQLRSVAHLFPKSKGRQGLYALGFANGDRYVGQTTNIVRRVAEHRRTWPDIVTVDFTRVWNVDDLDHLEQTWIHDEIKRRHLLRNWRHALGPVDGDCDLDLEMTRPEQDAWLNDGQWLPDPGERTEHPGQRMKTQARYDQLKKSPLFGDVVRGLGAYVRACVPRPRATEQTFWAVSAAPSTNRTSWPRLTAVSINSMETLVLGHKLGQPHELWGFMNISRGVGSAIRKVRLPSHYQKLKFVQRKYEAAGPDVMTVEFGSIDQLLWLLDDPSSPVRDAARTLNLRVMRKGPTFQWRSHCPRLADNIL